ncbi:hypothetical protein [Phenylobacterium immobile]|uniref:hypothetical protein n=1 Tax=Phenylobacterium immobile TaxID=21 RepID=UPI000A74FE3C|nr:hypothetical protein [Phenylobacterium immobile]
MAARRIIVPGAMPSRDQNGRALPALLRFYATATNHTEPATVYLDAAMSTPAPFPIESDAAGRFPSLWAEQTATFDVTWSDQIYDRQIGAFAAVTPIVPAASAEEIEAAAAEASAQAGIATTAAGSAMASATAAGGSATAAAGSAAAANASAMAAGVAEMAADASAVSIASLPGTGDLFAAGPIMMSVGVSNGATSSSAEARQVGVSVPSGQTGNSSIITARINIMPEELAALAGKTIRITAIYAATAGFLAAKPLLTANPVAITRVSTGGTTGGTHISTVQNSTTITRIVEYTVPTDLTAVGVIAQLGTSLSTASTFNIDLTSVGYVVVTTGAVDPRLTAIQQRDVRDIRRAGMGSAMDDLVGTTALSGGATSRSLGGKLMGITIPTGQTGGTSYVQPRLTLPPRIRALLAGKTIRISIAGNINTAWGRTINLLSQVVLSNGSTRTNTGSRVIRNQKVGPRWFGEILVPMVGDEYTLQPYVQNGTPGTSAQDDYIEITDWAWDVVAPASDVPTDQVAERIRGERASTRPQVTDLLDDASMVASVANGAALRNDYTGRPIGMTIPAGQTGASSFLQSVLTYDADESVLLPGQTLRFTLVAETNADWARTPTITAQVKTVGGTRNVTPAVRQEQFGTTRIIEFEVACTTNDLWPQPFFQIPSGVTTAQDDWIELRAVRMEVVQTADTAQPLGAINALQAEKRASRRAADQAASGARGNYGRRFTVAPSGANYTTVAAAFAAVNDARRTKRYEIKGLGVLNEQGLSTKSFVDFSGDNPARSHLKGYLVGSTALGTVTNTSQTDVRSDFRAANTRASMQGGRYVFHVDFASLVDCDVVFENVDAEHYGNAEVLAYQAANGNPSGTGVWTATYPFGVGMWSGMTLTLRNVRAKGKVPFYAHTRGDFSKPSKIVLENCQLTPTVAGPDAIAVQLQPSGSGQADSFTMVGCELRGTFRAGGTGWLTNTPALQIADHMEFVVTGHSNSPAAYVYDDCGSRALRVQSNSTGGSSAITVSGALLPYLFGEVITDVSGGGLPGAVFGKWDVANHMVGQNSADDIVKLSVRIAAAVTAGATTMAVAVDGGSNQTITVDASYGAMSQSAILWALNAQLTGAAFSEMDVSERWRPRFSDEELVFYNSGGTAILRKHPIARNTDGDSRPMTDSDSAALFQGIALENIPPGSSGRGKLPGKLLRVSVDFDRSDGATSFGAGDSFGVSNSSGQLAKGVTPTVAMAINAADVRLGG